MPAADTVAEHAPPSVPAHEPAHAVAAGELLARPGIDPDRGLSEPEVAARRAKYGPNELIEAPPLWRKLLAQVTEPVVPVLLVAAVTAVGFALVYRGDEANRPRARTMAFCVASFAFILYVLCCRNSACSRTRRSSVRSRSRACSS